MSELPDSWDTLHVEDIFLKSTFLKALEASTPDNISTYFLGVFSSESLVGIAVVQRVKMYLDDVFRRTSNKFFKRLGKWLITRIVKGNALIVGNLMHTGQHGLYFDASRISQEDFLSLISEGIDELSQDIKINFNKNIRIIGLKDYFEADPIHENKDFFNSNKLYRAQVQPNMLFDIRDTWKSSEDYIGAFNKKYKRRYRTARKKGKALECIELTQAEINDRSDELYQLYLNVSDNAGVNSFKLHSKHFYELKKELQDDFKVYGYFLEDSLVGFYTFIKNYNVLETYFLGYNPDLQRQYQMYLNMLFDMACYGIDNNYKSVVFARTAMEIKSSIGAKPHAMSIYLKHTNSIIVNTILKLVVKYANPVRDWEERHPFK